MARRASSLAVVKIHLELAERYRKIAKQFDWRTHSIAMQFDWRTHAKVRPPFENAARSAWS